MAMSAHAIDSLSVEGFEALELVSPGGVTATFVPGAGMVCCSMTHDGAELLDPRGGVARYVQRRSTMGIPFLHPWGNRLGSLSYADVTLDPAAQVPPLRLDPNGLPIHGALAANPDWEVTDTHAEEGSALFVARLDFGANPELLAVFPYPHVVEQLVMLAGSTLSVATRVTPTGDLPVPIAFGWHPYFKLPGVPASEWVVDLPVEARLVTDERMIPTGEVVDDPILAGPLGDRTFDDGYVGVDDGTVFSLSGGGRRLMLSFNAGYPVAVVWRPEGGEFICIEPMTAQTSALVSGAGLSFADPGSSFTATFSLTVSPE
ncbi:MAG: aldose 1-epimerase [Thermoleophilaceae bacterium]|nr:aldose 1-epimerase [Thermoleophilaceae bacterium]